MQTAQQVDYAVIGGPADIGYSFANYLGSLMWASQLLLTITAVCAAWIAFQQWATARLKLNHDLFDKRYAVYVATQKHIVACLNSTGGNVGSEEAFVEARRVAPFLFDKEINEFLAQVGRHTATIQVFGRHVNSSELADHQSMMREYHAAQTWMLAELQGSAERFFTSLSLSNIKPFSMRDILWIPDIEAVKARISSKQGGNGNQNAT